MTKIIFWVRPHRLQSVLLEGGQTPAQQVEYPITLPDPLNLLQAHPMPLGWVCFSVTANQEGTVNAPPSTGD